ncbi:MAG TPA: SMC-Scp complex subunit ScpB [Pseudonocardiaceae bacterium]|nr:SMC-Scp complex subunit ScpB [Pseudonocardiaceae bacterium]
MAESESESESNTPTAPTGETGAVADIFLEPESGDALSSESTDPRAVLSDEVICSNSRSPLSGENGFESSDLDSEHRSQISAEQGEPADEGEAVEESDLPPLADDTELANALEALLLVVDTPAGEELLATTLDQSVARITEALHQMAADLTERGSGIDLRRVGDGWRFVTRDKYAPYVEKLLLDGQRAKLTRAALETLAVIAYRQPVTRSRVAAVRGVNVDGVIRTLVARGLIAETGTDSETGGILYRTTELFLERLGLSSLEDLPAIAPLLPEVDAIDDV